MLFEDIERRQGTEFEIGQAGVLTCRVDSGKGLADRGIANGLAIDANSLVISPQMWRSVAAHAVTGFAINRLQHGDTGTFAVGPGDCNDRTGEIFRVQVPPHLLHARQAEINGLGMQLLLPLQPIGESLKTHYASK